uniref:Uncharacterized protein n=1 Tax=Hordeum vulgare subsp. vulgare TaxID=112509 RepID=A0A8I6Z7G9_HORVV
MPISYQSKGLKCLHTNCQALMAIGKHTVWVGNQMPDLAHAHTFFLFTQTQSRFQSKLLTAIKKKRTAVHGKTGLLKIPQY